MVNLGNILDPSLDFKIGDNQVHSIWLGGDKVWPTAPGLVFVNARWRVIPPYPVYSEIWTSDGGGPPSLITKIWTSATYTVTQTGCMDFGMYGPLPNTAQKYVVRIMRADTNVLISATGGSTVGWGDCPDNSYLQTSTIGQVLISGEELYVHYPELTFDIVSLA